MRPEAKETIHTKLPENSKEYSPLDRVMDLEYTVEAVRAYAL